jgi:pimeloyl-ACP methyl ester carboxylesterase
VCGALAALGVAAWLHLRYWVRKLSVPLHYASVERLALPDGGAIELRRIAREPADAPLAQELPPVLIVHGIGANHRNLDLAGDRSLARLLTTAGRDVWLVTLRSALATRQSLIRFEAMVKYDVPTAARAVRERTGSAVIDYVGFSMGGMLLYAALGRTVPESEVRRAAFVGSPGRIELPLAPLRFLRFLPRWLIPRLRVRVMSRLIAFAAEWVPQTPLHHIVYNPRNMPRGVAAMALVNMIEDLPGPLLADFAAWAFADGELRGAEGRLLDGLRRVEVPVTFFAGAADGLASPSSVRAAFEAWGADVPEFTGKQLRVVGVAHGSSADYGHGDLAIGVEVGREVFTPLVAFLGES